MPATRALRAALAEPWAITAEGLELVLSVAARENDVSIDALEAYRAEHVPTAERLTRRGPVAILDVRGPLVSRANLFTAISGATSYDVLRRDLQASLDDPSIRAIVMSYDTPGGSVTNVDELAKAIRAGKAIKPIVAYVGGSAASAGYWLASNSTEIVIADTALLGSIGVRAALQDTSKKDAEAGRIEFISSQSPGKRTDLSTDEGRARIQRTIDALAEVFIATVADGRGVKPDDVIAKFGGGDVLIGSAAVAAGMADRIGNFEAVIKELDGRSPSTTSKFRSNTMNEPMIARADHDAAVAAARTEGQTAGEKAGATAERTRIQAILNLPEAKGRETSAMHLAFTTDLSAETAKGVLSGLEASKPEPDNDADIEGQRSHEAVGGLVVYDPKADKQPNKAEKTKAAWGEVTSKLNARM
ncbi:S49 family peptidase [Brucella anthropi]|uniref:S49 family peptidase n=1 Tax=Brucella TaxID=234 RepID=UPI00110DB199|nr:MULTISPECIES: S49 family peptidase [Brucella]KAB2776523.1 S49 family peptidase [Brucella anthropi]TMV03108.1 S49 family peptidase [Brucella haematophila]